MPRPGPRAAGLGQAARQVRSAGPEDRQECLSVERSGSILSTPQSPQPPSIAAKSGQKLALPPTCVDLQRVSKKLHPEAGVLRGLWVVPLQQDSGIRPQHWAPHWESRGGRVFTTNIEWTAEQHKRWWAGTRRGV
ncbi:hypothetical protein EYF80_014442 [Liparis tanakae]|uniref:Uncharacterized protein n=1 Tax=Liparis tanakae TaxID=230148 RepID=A0A4Z2ID18_9TELE|nr:hypothetical protein EYF80_014442 [Liparis tanakae]